MPRLFAAGSPAAALLRGAGHLVLGVLALTAMRAAAALEYRTTVDPATILYDGPSLKAQKVFVVGRDYPFEVVVALEGWVKVRDLSGAPLFWVESKALGEKQVVVVKAPVADVLAAPEPGARTVFRAEQNVLLDVLDPPAAGWVHVRHQDGQTGYVSLTQVWGL